MSDDVCLGDIFAAQRRIKSTTVRTPMLRSDALSRLIDGEVFLKPEGLQPTGSFKVRGVSNKICQLSKDERDRGLITVSSGNHGRALAWLSRQYGVTATICLYSNVPEYKIDAIRQLGGQIEICGDTYQAAEQAANQLMHERGLTWIDPFDDLDVIAGQGVIGLEIMEDLPTADAVVVPLSGGGLFSGIATAIKHIRPSATMIGVANRHGNGMLASLDAGQPVPIEELPSLADCMAGTISTGNRHSFRITKDLIDRAIVVEESDVPDAMAHGFFNEGLIMEGGAVLPIAPLISADTSQFHNKTVVLIISGRNIDPHKFLQVMDSVRPT